MAQFDVHRNLGKNHDAIPFVVIVQSALFDSYRRRVVVPLVRPWEGQHAAIQSCVQDRERAGRPAPPRDRLRLRR